MFKEGDTGYLREHVASDGIEILAPKGAYVTVIEDEGMTSVVRFAIGQSARYFRVSNRFLSKERVV